MLTFTLATAMFATFVPSNPVVAIRHDDQGRPMIAVSMGDGDPVPIDMLVDTAAQATILSEELVDMLDLAPSEEVATVNGVAGSMAAAMYHVPHLSSPLFRVDDVTLIAVPSIGATRARGIVGMDLFAGNKLTFDIAAGQLSVTPSGPAGTEHVAVAGRVDDKGLMHVPVTIDGVVIDALVDTGAQGSIASASVVAMLGWTPDDSRLRAYGTISGATTGSTQVRQAIVDRVQLGPVTFRDVPLTFAGPVDAPPRLILGMDMLGLLQQFALDLPRAELQLHIPPATAPAP